MLAPARFPILAANVDASAEPELAARLRPYVIREIDGEKIAIVGLTTPVTPRITRDVGRVRFLDPAESLRKVMSVGLEDVEDILADLDQALRKASAKG